MARAAADGTVEVGAAMKVAVVGLGKIGLPLAVADRRPGAHRGGARHLRRGSGHVISRGSPPFPGEPELDDRIRAALADGTFRATTNTADAIVQADVVIVVVPLVVDGERQPDFRSLDAATSAVAPHLTAGVLVSYETTLPLGTTRRRFAPALGAGLRPRRRPRPVRVPQPGARLERPGVPRPPRLPQARRRGSMPVAPSGPLPSTRPPSTSTSGPTCDGPTASGIWAAWRPRSSRSWRRRPTETSTSPSPTSSRSPPTPLASTCRR